jgi:hypothetical protein
MTPTQNHNLLTSPLETIAKSLALPAHSFHLKPKMTLEQPDATYVKAIFVLDLAANVFQHTYTGKTSSKKTEPQS